MAYALDLPWVYPGGSGPRTLKSLDSLRRTEVAIGHSQSPNAAPYMVIHVY